MQLPQRSRKVKITLRLDVHLSTERRAQLELSLAARQLRGLFTPGLAAHAACHGAGDIVGEDAAAGVCVSAAAGLRLLVVWLVAVAEVELVQDLVEVGDWPLAVNVFPWSGFFCCGCLGRRGFGGGIGGVVAEGAWEDGLRCS